jgi:hypothetical protein
VANPTNIESLQAQMFADAQREQRRAALVRLLSEFQLQPTDATSDYPTLLQRVLTVVAAEVAALAPRPEPADEAAQAQPEEGAKSNDA